MLHVFISIWKTWGRGRERELERTWPHRLAVPFHIHSCCAHQRLSKATKKNIPSQRTWSEQERFGLWYANGALLSELTFIMKASFLSHWLCLSLCTSATPVLLFKIKRLQTTKRGLVEKTLSSEAFSPMCVFCRAGSVEHSADDPAIKETPVTSTY